MRRKFIDTEGGAPKESAEALATIGEIYAIEARANTGPPEERARLRNDESRPIVKRIEQWALSVQSLRGSGLRNTIEYMGRMWNVGLLRFLDDPNVPIDNNGTELCLRGVVLGRRNWFFVGSNDGAAVNTVFVSLIASARLHGIEPHGYLRDLFCLIRTWPSDRLLELAPAYWQKTLDQPETQNKLAANVFRRAVLSPPY